MDPVSRRLLKELNDYQREAKSHPEIIELCPADDEDLTQWRASIAGLNNTPFQGEKREHILFEKPCHHNVLLTMYDVIGGLWNLEIKIPHNYPMQPPAIKFVTPICHPNVHFKVATYY